MVLLQLKDPLELFVKGRKFLPSSRFLSRRDMTYAAESDVKPNSFLPSSKQNSTSIFNSNTGLSKAIYKDVTNLTHLSFWLNQ